MAGRRLGKWLAAALAGACLGAALAGCDAQPEADGEAIVRINDYVIDADEFRKRIATTVAIYGGGALSQEEKKTYLDQEVKKELLIQEAIRLGLEKEPSFRDSIQRYWEQTLITALLKRQTQALGREVVVTEEEVVKAHEDLCRADPACPPLAKVRAELERRIRDDKTQKALEDWLAALRGRALVKVFEDNLRSFK